METINVENNTKNNSPVDVDDLRALGPPIKGRWVGERVDRYLGEKFPFLSRNGWQKRCRDGRVLVGNQRPRTSYKLRPGDQVYHLYPPECEPRVNRSVFCFDHSCSNMVALYKPPHLPMHEGGSYRKNTFTEVVKEKWGSQWGAVHRLDRETSGIILCGRHRDVRAQLSGMFRSHSLEKVYDAVLMGEPQESSWVVDAPLGFASDTIWRTKRWVQPGGQEARTRFEVVESGGGLSRVRVYPVHGRTHQIRIHAAYCGHPIVGDTRYHPDEKVFLEFLEHGYSDDVLARIRAPRLCLHAARLRVRQVTRSSSLQAISQISRLDKRTDISGMSTKSELIVSSPGIQGDKLMSQSTQIGHLVRLSEGLELPMPDDMEFIWRYLRKNPGGMITELPSSLSSDYAQRWALEL